MYNTPISFQLRVFAGNLHFHFVSESERAYTFCVVLTALPTLGTLVDLVQN